MTIVYKNTTAAVNVRCNIVFTNYAYLIDAKNLLISSRIHARDRFVDITVY